MFNLFSLGLGVLVRLFPSRRNLVFENLVLRQQLVVLMVGRHPMVTLT